MTIMLYGIPNCDQVKKARAWMDRHAVSYTFHDFKKAGVTRELIAGWLDHLPWDVLVNRKGTTWRGLSESQKTAVIDAETAIAVMLAFPSVIKRPVLVAHNTAHVGFSDALYQQIFKK
jgi:arsenate reductase (glutaredoxin)